MLRWTTLFFLTAGLSCGSAESTEVGSVPSARTQPRPPAPHDSGGRKSQTQQPAPAPSPTQAPAAPSGPMVVLFKVDLGGTYGGAQWIPPPFKSGLLPSDHASVDARVQGVDPAGRATRVGAVWTASDPRMVVISPLPAGDLEMTRISVKGAGEYRITVSSDVASIELRMRASYALGGAMQIEIGGS